MNIITNNSDYSFVLNVTTRKSIESENRRNILNELKLIAAINDAVCVYRCSYGLSVAAVESRDFIGMYLLAECILHQLQQPEADIIYVELYKDAYFTLVRTDGEIIIDSFANNIATREMLLALESSSKYKIYSCHADDLLESIHLRFEKVSSLIEIAVPVQQYKLLAKQTAVHPYDYEKRVYMGIAASVFFSLFVYFFIPKNIVQDTDTIPAPDPYEEMRTSLASPSLDHYMLFFHSMIERVMLFDNWRPINITFQHGRAALHFRSHVDSLEVFPPMDELYSLQNDLGGTLQFDNKEILMTFAPKILNREQTNVIYPAAERLAYLVSHLSDIALFKGGSPINHGEYKEINARVSMHDVNPQLLRLVAYTFYNEPVVLNTATISINENYNINANFSITVYGS